MKFRIVPIKHDGGYKWELQRESVIASHGWYTVSCYTWKWQAKRMARHLATAEEVFSVD
jgi:hypothetical protein